MEIAILSFIGLLMGLLGGLLGIGGSIVMIPAMVIAFGENQHLYQASAMICNFFVAASAVLVHHKADMLVRDVLKWLFPAAAIAIIAGVAGSNLPIFARENSYLLARLFGAFMLYLAIFNLLRFGRGSGGATGRDISDIRRNRGFEMLTGTVTGLTAGLLGIGGGSISTPMQQMLLKMPLKRAISNSAAVILSISLIGAVYKNATLGQHDIALWESLRIAMVVIPTAVIGSAIGGRLMHRLHKDAVRAVFVALAFAAAARLLTVGPG